MAAELLLPTHDAPPAAAPTGRAASPPPPAATHPVVAALRRLVVALLWRPLLATVGPLVVDVRGPLPAGGCVVVARHASHADTVALLVALRRAGRRRAVAAAATDYWFASRWRAAVGVLFAGAVPMPRRGPEGIHLVRRLVADGWTVVLYPEGSRSAAARRWRRGVGHLAAEGVPVVVARVDGTAELLPAGAAVPRPSAVAVTLRAAEVRAPGPAGGDAAARIAAALAAAADRLPAPPAAVPAWPWRLSARLTTTARGGGWLVLLVWAAAEAVAWPLIPDVALAGMAFAAPALAPRLWAATAAGSVLGGLAALAAGQLVRWPLPLVTADMAAHARAAVAAEGPVALLHQPLSGVPYKAWVAAAADAGVDPLAWAAWTATARGGRMAVVAAVAAAAGHVLHRAAGADRWPLVHVAAVGVGAAGVLTGLAAVVAAWS